MENPIVSVIIPNYNHAPYLKERIESVLAQSFQDFELIILDDCSTDSSREIIELYKSNDHVSHVVLNQENSGNTFVQWKRGVDLAKGQYVWIAESDDVAHPSFLEVIVAQMMQHPNAVLAFSHSFLIDDEGHDLHINKHLNNNPDAVSVYDGARFARRAMLRRNDIYNASMVVFRRDEFYNVDDNYRRYRTCGDWAFWMSLCLQGGVIEVCRQLNSYRQHAKKVTTQAGRTGDDWLEVGDLLHHFISQLSLSGISLRLFRGKWTKDFRESQYPDKNVLIARYPDVFGGSKIDIFLYGFFNLSRRLLNK